MNMPRFKDEETRRLYDGESVRDIPPEVVGRARQRVTQVYDASTLRDLLIPRSNRLELLQGDRDRRRSIRVNRQWRVCFIWTRQGAIDIEINKHYEP